LNENDDYNQVEINIVLDKTRYKNLVEICKKYKEQHGTELTPKEYVLMLIDSAILLDGFSFVL
jgi:vacuolar-type H+-ATPase subunit C/Vma6